MLLFTKAADGHGAIEMDRRRAPGEPTPAQAEAGNYEKPVIDWCGLKIAIENKAGSVRYGNGWQTRMLYDYGYVKRSEGADGDDVDVYLGPSLTDATCVYVVHQRKYGAWDQFDEDKAMLGFLSVDDAKVAYLKHYDDPRFLGDVTTMSVDEFVAKVKATKDDPSMIKTLFFKSHVAAYRRADGTAVHAHDRKPLYVSRKVLNADAVHAWATAAGFKHVVPADKMHVTVAYSRAPVHHGDVNPDHGAVAAVPQRVGRLGDGDAHVLHVEHPRLHARFADIAGIGASWDHDGGAYSPHVTISYKPQDRDMTDTAPPAIGVHLGPEVAEDLQSGWGEKLVTKPVGRPLLLAKTHVGAYMRGGRLVNLAGYQVRGAMSRPGPGQMALFADVEQTAGRSKTPAAPALVPSPPHPLAASAAKLTALRARVAEARAKGEDDAFLQHVVDAHEGEHAKLESAFAAHARGGDGTEMSHSDGQRHAILLPDASSPGKYRYQTFDANGFMAHSTHDTEEEAVADAARQGYHVHNPGVLDRLAGTDEWAHGMAINAIMQAHNGKQIDWATAMARVKALQDEREAGKLAAAKSRKQTESQEFKKWFGDSKVVDDQGKPLVVYHGTGADFEAFSDNSRGIFFAESPDTAAPYARIRRNGHPRTIPAYVSIKNPWTMIAYGDDVPYSQMENQTVAALEAKGYDGTHDQSSGVWVAFRPEQIKSAIGNNGAFDPDDPNITKSWNWLATNPARSEPCALFVKAADRHDTHTMSMLTAP